MRSTLVVVLTGGIIGIGGGLGTGCAGAINRFTVNSTAPVLKLGSAAMDSESDLQLAREAAPASLKTVESFLVVSPENKDLLEVLAQGYSQFAFGFTEDELESLGDSGDAAKKQSLVVRATDYYDRGYGFAVRLAALEDKQIVEAIKGDLAGLDNVLKHGDFDDAEDSIGIYWAGLSMASAINLNKDDMNRVADLPKVIALLERAHQVGPNYFNHGPALALGVVYASQGKAMGGDPVRAKIMFDEVINATGGKYLMAKVLYARVYATVVQDRPLFEKTLKEVIDAPADIWPAQRLANELAKKRAVRYLAQAEDLFLPPEPAGADKQ